MLCRTDAKDMVKILVNDIEVDTDLRGAFSAMDAAQLAQVAVDLSMRGAQARTVYRRDKFALSYGTTVADDEQAANEVVAVLGCYEATLSRILWGLQKDDVVCRLLLK